MLDPNPKGDTYGIVKVICTGPTEEDVTAKVGFLLKEGQLESGLPFIKVCATGGWLKLNAYGNDDEVIPVSVATGRVEDTYRKQMNQQKAEQVRSIEEQTKLLQEELKNGCREDPDSYDTYCRWKNQFTMATQRLKQLEAELKQVQKAKKNAVNAIKQMDSKHGNYRLKHKAEGFLQSEEELKCLQEAESVVEGVGSSVVQSVTNGAALTTEEGKGKEESA
jgi:hypothetical protein